ncbi:MAG: glycosyltransferase family 4 protein [Terracidiphilus sp.]|jgi:glycosyltransferase involved in cell wall biosynthesis
MAAPNISLNSQSNTLKRRVAWPPALGKEPASALQLVPSRSLPARVAVVGNHLPRQCGIATFTTDLCDAMADEYGGGATTVVAINDRQSSYAYPARVRCEIDEGDISSYRTAAYFLNSSHVDLVSLQHEYGIFGGNAGSHVLELLEHLNMPVVTTLHTVLRQPDIHQRFVMQQIAARSERLIVMSEYSSRVLRDVYGVPGEKIDLIPHGIPDLAFVDPDVYKDALAIAGKLVLLTFGLLSPNKGFESVIRALPRILARHSDVVYVIAGATHPHVRAQEGDRYRHQLQALAREVGVEREVIFHNRFFSPKEMAGLVGSADIYITPYCHEAQAVSGTLAYAMGAGKAIISTPYWHAAELLDDGRGALVPFENPVAIAAAAIELLDNDTKRLAMRKRAYLYARKMVWNRVAQSYMHSFVRARVDRIQLTRFGVSAQVVEKNVASQLPNAYAVV